MKVILNENVASVGQKGAVVNVSEGYAINYLFARKLAQPATASTLKQAEHIQKQQAEKEAVDANELKTRLESLKGTTLKLSAKANDEGHLFAAIQAKDIHDALKEHKKAELPDTYIQLSHPIKEVGKHDVTLGTKDRSVSMTLEIVSEK